LARKIRDSFRADHFFQFGVNDGKLIGPGGFLEGNGFSDIVETTARRIMDIQNLNRVQAFITKDGSEIRELLAHRNSCIHNQTLAEARLHAGATTSPHRHVKTEEIYYILEGRGLMQIGDESADVGPGDAIAIPPGAIHQITNVGDGVLRFLCCCAPGYEHDDTVLENLIP
jgi:mannose-6-phosphate isomerase-like protein (cupin superfamily)